MDRAASEKRVFLPTLELLSREELEDLQGRKLRRQCAQVYATNSFYKRLWDKAGFSPDDIKTHADVVRIPFTTKEDFIDDQEQHPPYGLRLGVPEEDVFEISLTSGTSGKGREVHAHTVRDAHLRGQMTAVAFAWGGLTAQDIAIFHITATNSASLYTMLRGIRSVGRLPYLVGHMGFEERLEFMERFGVNAMYAMPSALNGMATLCLKEGIDPRKAYSGLRFIIHSAESWPVEWIRRMEEFWGAELMEVYGSTQTNAAFGAACCEHGSVIGNERGNLHLFEWTTLYEVVDPETSEPVHEGEPGELIITHLDKQASPIMRFRTGDRGTFFKHTRCPCGRQLNILEAGTIGRVDEMLKVKGQNIWPPDIDALLFSHPEIDEYQVRTHIGEKGRDEIELTFSVKEGFESRQDDMQRELTRELKAATDITFRIQSASADALPHFDTPDKKPRRWTDERHAGLAQGVGQLEPSGTR